MILLTETFSESKEINEKDDKFKVYYFKFETIQCFLSGNPKGSLLNKPTSIEMNSSDKPYYYILNYHSYEGKRILHLKNVLCKIKTIKIATEINNNDWHDFIKNLKSFDRNECQIEEQKNIILTFLKLLAKPLYYLIFIIQIPQIPKQKILIKMI